MPEILRHIIVSASRRRTWHIGPFTVERLSHSANATHEADVYVNLRCSVVSSHGDCGAHQQGSIRMSNKYPTVLDCLRELGQRILLKHCPTCVAVSGG